MFGWLKRKAQLKIISMQEMDINRFIMGLKGASPPEVAGILAIANHWRNVLEREYGWDLDHPDVVAMQDVGAAAKLNGMIRDVQKKEPALATGLMVWLHTIRASQTPEIKLLGRDMWAQLARGMPHVEETVLGMRRYVGLNIDTSGYQRVPTNLGQLQA